MEYSGTWKEIWTQKGAMEGTKEDIRVFDGWEKSTADMKETADRIMEILDIKPTDRVLEVGCGAGGLAQYMDCEYIGIDFSKTLVNRCMEFYQKSAVYSEANDIPFKDKYFDKCFSWGVFLYFPSREYVDQVISEMKRVTKNRILLGNCQWFHMILNICCISRSNFKNVDLKQGVAGQNHIVIFDLMRCGEENK